MSISLTCLVYLTSNYGDFIMAIANETVLTPVGNLIFTKVAGEGKKFDKNEPKEKEKYEVNVRLTPEEFAPLKEEIDNFYTDQVSTKEIERQTKSDEINVPYSKYVEKDKEGNETETDDYVVKLRTNRFFKNGDEKVIPVLDAQCREYPEGHFANRYIGHESTGRAKGLMQAWKFQNKEGVSIYLQCLQLAHLVESNMATEGVDQIKGDASIAEILPEAEAPDA